jgi:hypothetical protein
MRSRRRLLAGGAAALVVVFGAGAALGASGATNPASSFLGDVAKKLGISEEKLTDAIKAAQIDRIDAAQARGDITKEQADALKTQVRNGKAPTILPGFRAAGPPKLGLPGLGQGFGGRLFFKGGLGLGKSESLTAAADYLGMTQAELRDALANGTSPADLAKEKGKSVDGLKAAVKKPIKAKVDKAVEEGLLTKEQGDQLYGALSSGVDAFIDSGLSFKLGPGPRGFRFDFHMDGDTPQGSRSEDDVPAVPQVF